MVRGKPATKEGVVIDESQQGEAEDDNNPRSEDATTPVVLAENDIRMMTQPAANDMHNINLAEGHNMIRTTQKIAAENDTSTRHTDTARNTNHKKTNDAHPADGDDIMQAPDPEHLRRFDDSFPHTPTIEPIDNCDQTPIVTRESHQAGTTATLLNPTAATDTTIEPTANSHDNPTGHSTPTLPIPNNGTTDTSGHASSPPLDDTIAQAVGTLYISHSTSPHTQAPADARPWTLVTNTQKKDPARLPSNSQEFGLTFERTTKGNNWSTDDLLLILQTIKTHDPKAMLSSADNKTKPTPVTAILHKARKDTPWFTKFTAMKTMTWGKPSDGTTKIVFSFWITSNIIKKDLAQLRMDPDLTEMLKGTNTYMKVTKLLEPHSKIVGYFLGKDIIHTNRDDITNRLAAHITKYSQTIWTPALDVLNTTVLGKGHNTRMVTLVVGNSDYQGVLDILTQQPMETLSFLDHRSKRQDINQFDKMLKYHDYIVSHSTAVRLEKVTSLDTQALWEHLQPVIDTTYCDISDGRIQGTTYIQCFKEKEPDVTAAIQSYLLMKFSDSEGRPIIGARGGGTVNSSSTGTRTYRGNPSGKSTGKEITATLNQKSQKDFAAFLKNCPTIDVPYTLPTRQTSSRKQSPNDRMEPYC